MVADPPRSGPPGAAKAAQAFPGSSVPQYADEARMALAGTADARSRRAADRNRDVVMVGQRLVRNGRLGAKKNSPPFMVMKGGKGRGAVTASPP